MSDKFMVFVPGSTKPPEGPLDLAELESRIRSGAVANEAMVCLVGSDKWVPLAQVIKKTPDTPPRFEIKVGDNVVGPVTLDQIRRGIDAGKVPGDAKVRQAGADAWQSVSAILTTGIAAPVTSVPSLESRATTRDGSMTSPKLQVGMLRTAALVLGVLLVVGVVVLVAGGGKGEKLYKTCEALTGDLDKVLDPDPMVGATDPIANLSNAREKCQAVVEEDGENGKWCKQAKIKVEKIDSLLAQARAEKAKRDAVAAEADRKAQAARLADLRRKISKKYWDEDPDSQCTGKGLPPYKWSYSGGTFAEDQEVAEGDGCRKLHQTVELQVYCCPQKPVAGPLW